MADCSITYNGKTYTQAKFAQLLKGGLLYHLLDRQIINLPAVSLGSLKVSRTGINQNFVSSKEDVKQAMQEVFGLPEAEAQSVSEIYDRLAFAWAYRHNTTRDKFYQKISIFKGVLDVLKNAKEDLLFKGLEDFRFVDDMQFEDNPDRSSYTVYDSKNNEVGIVEVNKNENNEFYVSWFNRTGGNEGDGARIFKATMQNLINKGLPVAVDTHITSSGFAAMQQLVKEGFLEQVGDEITESNQKSRKPMVYQTPPFIISPSVKPTGKILFQETWDEQAPWNEEGHLSPLYGIEDVRKPLTAVMLNEWINGWTRLDSDFKNSENISGEDINGDLSTKKNNIFSGGRVLNQNISAAVALVGGGRSIIYALTNPNVSSPLHELAHIWERELTDAERQSVLDWTGHKAWTRETSEAFATGFEKYLSEGTAPTPVLNTLFEQFKDWLTNIYKGVVGSPLDLELNDSMKVIYSKMLGENFKAVVEKAVGDETNENSRRNFLEDTMAKRMREYVEPVLENKQEKLKQSLEQLSETDKHLRPVPPDSIDYYGRISEIQTALRNNTYVDLIQNGQLSKEDLKDILYSVKWQEEKEKSDEAAEKILSNILFKANEIGSTYSIDALVAMNTDHPMFQQLSNYFLDSGKFEQELETDGLSVNEAKRILDSTIGMTKNISDKKSKLLAEINKKVGNKTAKTAAQTKQSAKAAIKVEEITQEAADEGLATSAEVTILPSVVITPEIVQDTLPSSTEIADQAPVEPKEEITPSVSEYKIGDAVSYKNRNGTISEIDEDGYATVRDKNGDWLGLAAVSSLNPPVEKEAEEEIEEVDRIPDEKVIAAQSKEERAADIAKIDGLQRIANRMQSIMPSIKYEMGYFIGSWKGRNKNGVVQINISNATLETPIHEFLHPFVLALRLSNPELYSNLLEELRTGQLSSHIDEVKNSKAYRNLSEQEIEEEAMIRYLSEDMVSVFNPNGTVNEEAMEQRSNSFLARVYQWFVDIYNKLFGSITDRREKLNGEVAKANSGATTGTIKSMLYLTYNKEENLLKGFTENAVTNAKHNTQLRRNEAAKKAKEEGTPFDPKSIKDEKPSVSFRIKYDGTITKEMSDRGITESVISQIIDAANQSDKKAVQINPNDLIYEKEESKPKMLSVSQLPVHLNERAIARSEDAIKNLTEERDILPTEIISLEEQLKTATDEDRNDIQELITEKRDRLALLSDKESFRKEVNSLRTFPVRFTLRDLSDFLLAQNTVQMDFSSEQTAIDKLNAYEHFTDKEASDYLESIKKRIPTFEDEGKRRVMNAQYIPSEVSALKRIVRDYDGIEAMSEYIRQGIGGLALAHRMIRYIQEDLKREDLTEGDINQLQRDVLEMRSLLGMYDDVSQMYDYFSDEFDKNDRTYFDRVLSRAERKKKALVEIAIDLQAKWLFPHLEEAQKNLPENKKLTYEKFRRNIRFVDNDISSISYWLGPAINSRDPLSGILAVVLKDKLNSSHIEELDKLNEIRLVFDKWLKKTGVSNTVAGVEEYYKNNYLRKAKVWETLGVKKLDPKTKVGDKTTYGKYQGVVTDIDSEGVAKISGYVERWAFHEQYLMDLYDDDFRKFKETLKQPETDVDWDNYNKIVNAWNNSHNPIISKNPKYVNPNFQRVANDEYFQLLYNTYKDANAKYGERALQYGIVPQAYRTDSLLDKGKAALEKGKDLASRAGDKETYKPENLVKGAIGAANYVFDADEFMAQQDANLDGTYYRGVKSPFTHLIDTDRLDLRLNESVFGFFTAASTFASLREVQANAENLKMLLEGNSLLNIKARKVAQVDKDGKTLFDKFWKGRVRDTGGLATRTNRQLLEFINDVFYKEDEFQANLRIGKLNINFNKMGRNLGFMTALTNLAGNVFAGVSNSTLGNIMSFQEAIGGKYYNTKDWGWGAKTYAMNSHEFIGDSFRPVKSKITQLAILYDAIQGEFRDKFGKNITGNIAKRYGTTDTFFMINHVAEHQIQLTGMLALMKATQVKLKNGESVSLYDAHQANAQGFYKMRSDAVWSNEDNQKFMRTLHGISKDLNGNYAAFDKGTIQRHWWGKLALQYRKYMYPAWRSRFASERVDYERGEVLEGFYRTFLKKLQADIKNYRWNIAMIGASQVRGLFTKGAKGWTADQQYAHRKTMVDLGIVIGTTMLAIALASMEGSGDDDKDKWAKNALMLQMLRLRSDMSQFNYLIVPEAFRIVNNPSASLNTLKSWGDFTMQITSPFEEYSQNSGYNKEGQNKLSAKAEKILPLYRQWLKLQKPEEMVKYFNLINKSVDTNNDDEKDKN